MNSRKLLVFVATAAVVLAAYQVVASVDDAVSAGQAALQELAKNNTEIVKALDAALQAGDLEAAKEAYAKSRWAYEQIEVWAGGFEEIDCDIDCRPYAFDYGEALDGAFLQNFLAPGTHFKGFHKIEGLLYRDGDVGAAAEFSAGLMNSSADLETALADSSNFNGVQALSNAAGLAREVASKKISSEEETFSDLSILIFDNNFKGIRAVLEPFMDHLDNETAQELSDSLAAADASVDGMCKDYTDGTTCTPYSKVTTKQRAEIAAAANRLSNAIGDVATSLNLTEEGGEEDEGSDCVASAPAASYAGDSPEIQKGLQYFLSLMPDQLDAAKKLKEAISSGDVEASKKAYTASRPYYEQIEVLAGSFEDTDCSIDCRPYSFDEGEESEDFKGFHRLEHLIYRDELNNQTWAESAADELISLLETLEKQLGDSSLFNSEMNFDGMLGLSNEVVAKKISSEEETWSDLSVLIFDNNWKGIMSQARPFFDGAPDNGQQVEDAYANAQKCIASLYTNSTGEYTVYSEVPMSGDSDSRECIIQYGYALRDAIAGLANALNIYDECHPFHESAVYKYKHKAGLPA